MRFAWVDDNCKPPQGVRVRDLIAALGEANRLAGVENELARYWQQRLKILSELFDLPPDWVEDTAHTPRMIADLAQACCRGRFFEQFLEYTSLRGEEEIRSHHKSHVDTQEALLRERLLDLAEDFLLHFWLGLKGKHFREEELVSKGLPPSEPDRLDFI